MLNSFPQDLLAKVFSRFPVKTLLIIRCVCKAWYSIIHDPNFAQLQLQNYKNNAENRFLLTRECSSWKELMFVRDTNTFTKLANLDAKRYLKLGYVDGVLREEVVVPRSYEQFAYLSTNDCHVVGCVDGVLLIHTYNPRVNGGQPRIILWNPSIRKAFEIPSFTVNLRRVINFGFGFDRVTNEYKVVAVGATQHHYSKTKVFRLVKGSWSFPKQKRPNPIIPNLYLEKFSSTTNFEGAIYWLASNDRNKRTRYSHLLCFDMWSETFACITLPKVEYKEGNRTQSQKRCSSVLNKKLAIVDFCFAKQNVCIWVREFYGGISYWWTKLYSVDLRIRKFLYLKENGELFFYGKSKRYVSYNFENQLVKSFGRYDRQNIVFMDTYKQSLVLLGGYGQAINSKRQVENKIK